MLMKASTNGKSFNPLEFSIALSDPRRLTGVTSWHEHIPFAFVIVQMLCPRMIVELGAHKGDSYCAFCQAVDMLGLDTKCYAVDSWEGDEHSGKYESSIFEELQAYHDPVYARFSTLLKKMFDEAVLDFEDQSIDLLHIDGLHTYDAVRHDFDTWLPKVSNQGVLLFHDTNVRERDFGVWKLWTDLANAYPSFEFKHGHGLGVLAVGRDVPVELNLFLSGAATQKAEIRRCFEVLGQRVASKEARDALAAAESRARSLQAAIDALYESTSWRITRPLRAVRRIFDGF